MLNYGQISELCLHKKGFIFLHLKKLKETVKFGSDIKKKRTDWRIKVFGPNGALSPG